MTTGFNCRRIRKPMCCRAGPVLRATWIAGVTTTTELRNFSRNSRGEPRADVRLFFQLPLQLAHERRQTGAAFALEPLGLEDRLHLGEGVIDIVIDDDVIVFRPVTQFGGW